jgi:hypothetical protein
MTSSPWAARSRMFAMALLLATLVLPLALADPDDPEPKGEKARTLRRDMQAFLALTPERREELIQLDQDLAREDPARRNHLLAVAQRYREWFDRLDEKDRKKIREAPDKNTRLEIIKDLREQEWLRFQPKSYRDQVAALDGQERADFLKKIRKEEQDRHQDWLIATRFWNELTSKNFQPPARTSELPREIQEYVNEYLKPMLSKAEKERLTQAEGQWPLYPQTLVELADRHPPALPGPEGPKTFNELPTEVQKRLKTKMGPLKSLKLNEGRWPDFAIVLADFAARNKQSPFPHELWPTTEKGLSPPMVEFLNNQLRPVLTPDEIRKLANAEGKWPEYPETIQELARNHKLPPPWLTLPGPRERWDNYRLPKAAGRE